MGVEPWGALVELVEGATRSGQSARAKAAHDAQGHAELPRSGGFHSVEISPEAFVEHHLKNLVEQGAECATCPWQEACRGYFKWPDSAYSCAGVKQLFSIIEAAAGEIKRDLASRDEQSNPSAREEPGAGESLA